MNPAPQRCILWRAAIAVHPQFLSFFRGMFSAGYPPIMHSSLRWVTVAAAAFLVAAPLGAQRIKVTTQSVICQP